MDVTKSTEVMYQNLQIKLTVENERMYEYLCKMQLPLAIQNAGISCEAIEKLVVELERDKIIVFCAINGVYLCRKR